MGLAFGVQEVWGLVLGFRKFSFFSLLGLDRDNGKENGN